MDGLLLTLSVIGLFLLRVGVPVVLLIVVGMLVERWQRHREAEVKQYMATHPPVKH